MNSKLPVTPDMTPVQKNNLISLLLCLLAGIATSFAFSPYDISPLAVFGPAVLIYIWLTAAPGKAFACGYVFGLGLFGTGVNWIHISINLFGGVNFLGAIGLTFLFIAFLALYPAGVGYLFRRCFASCSPFIGLLLIAPTLWVIGEWTKSWLFTGFPWLNLGYSQIDAPLGGLAAVTGVYGISGAIMLTAGALAGLFRRGRVQKITGIVLVLLLWSAGWSLEQRQWTSPRERDVSVVLVQGAVPQAIKWKAEMRPVSLDLYTELSRPYLDHDLIIWPETAIPMFYYPGAPVEEDLSELTRHNNGRLLVGLPFVDRESKKYFNSIVMFNDKVSYYHKRHLVPFGEYLPFKSLLSNVLNFLKIPMSDFSAGGAERPLLEDERFKIGVSICYEDTFGEEVIEALPDAEILVNISNDAWFGDSAAPHQHLQMARMRARETGRYLLRATNTGISAIIDEKGDVADESAQFVPAALAGTAVLFQGATPYVRYGNYPVIIFSFLVLMIALGLGKKSG
jgi:apolipoprotein N-acyltransferase